ncbi:NAD(P)-binding protein [Epithele typhae]|uniref:NAD(P)-binding protein n=1 Tax=Epithele typhae TaxID=378194 RepID=UPI002008BD59|nr:NAD(P)-binding protein [Epithele typhae]KAH9915578.1 NAD(P)-binding protein [Epithele typhae]
MSDPKPLFVVLGVGNGQGTGGATARLFAKQGYRVALMGRDPERLQKFANELNASGGEAAAFPAASYGFEDVLAAFALILTYAWPSGGPSELRVALHNAGYAGPRKGLMDVTAAQLHDLAEVNVHAAFAFARASIEAFRTNALDARGKRGTLLFTGATGSLRGNTTTAAFSAGKFALRSLSQSLNKEFGKENIHVAHVVCDGPIMTDLQLERLPKEFTKDWGTNADIRLSAASIADAYWYLTNQDRSAWTWELDVRSAHEKW